MIRRRLRVLLFAPYVLTFVATGSAASNCQASAVERWVRRLEQEADLGNGARMRDVLDAMIAEGRWAGTPADYEELGAQLLSLAREVRFDGDQERALGFLDAAGYAFALAERDAPDALGESAIVQRAMVFMEKLLASRSDEPWTAASVELHALVRTYPESPSAAWARRILAVPASYVADVPNPDVEPAVTRGDVHPPVRIFTPQARYTKNALRACVQGAVVLRLVVDRHGTVAGVEVLKSLPFGLAESAARTAATWLFEPARRDGKPVVAYHIALVSFRLLPRTGERPRFTP